MQDVQPPWVPFLADYHEAWEIARLGSPAPTVAHLTALTKMLTIYERNLRTQQAQLRVYREGTTMAKGTGGKAMGYQKGGSCAPTKMPAGKKK